MVEPERQLVRCLVFALIYSDPKDANPNTGRIKFSVRSRCIFELTYFILQFQISFKSLDKYRLMSAVRLLDYNLEG